jgi:hypothetical protein
MLDEGLCHAKRINGGALEDPRANEDRSSYGTPTRAIFELLKPESTALQE